MTKSETLLLASTLFLAILGTVACGSTPRGLQSITLSPASADAQNFPGGEVQFTATGHFNKPPLKETPFSVGWEVSDTAIATINNDGLAQCVVGGVGTVTVKGSLTVVGIGRQDGFDKGGHWEGTAQLICP